MADTREKTERKAKLTKPDKLELERQIDVIQNKINAQENESKDIKNQIDKILSDRSGSRGEFETAKAAMQTLIAEKKNIQNEKNILSAARDAARDKIADSQNAEKAARADLKFESVEAIDKQIRDLETRQARTTMSLQDEKKIIKDIKNLQLSKRSLAAIADMKTEIAKSRAAKEEIEKSLSEKMSALKNVNDRINAQRDILDAFNKDNSTSKDQIPALRKRQNDIRSAVTEDLKKIKTLRNEFKTAMDAFYAQLQEERARQKEAKQKEYEIRKAEKEALQKQMEEEELKRIPYEDEINLCDYLVNYLQSIKPQDDQPVDSNSSASTSSTAVPEGLVLFQRMDNEFLNLNVTKKRGKKKGGSNAKRDVIVHGVDTVKSFALLNISPPATSTAILSAIEQLQSKKTYYQGLERGAVPSIMTRHKESGESQQLAKSKTVFNLDADFPGL